MKDLCQLFQVKQLCTFVYHPQMDGLAEWFNMILKQMLRKAVDQDGRNWDQHLHYLLFSMMEVPQALTGFSPFELLYAHRPRRLLVLESWEEQPSPHRSMIEHVDKVFKVSAAVWWDLISTGHRAKSWWNY